MTTSAQIASFVADIREHLRQETAAFKISTGESFATGFTEGFLFWQKVYQAEDEFRYALGVLEDLLRPIGIAVPVYRRLRFVTGSSEAAVQELIEEFRLRDKELGVVQKELLGLSLEDEKKLWSPELREEFELSFQEGLRGLLG